MFGASSVRLRTAATPHEGRLHSRLASAKATLSACTWSDVDLAGEFSRSQRTGFDRITNTVTQGHAGRPRAAALAVYNQRGRRSHQVQCWQAEGPTAALDRPGPRRSPPRTRSGADQGWSTWVETGRVCTDRYGRAVNPNSDYHAWKALLKRAGVREHASTTPGTPLQLCLGSGGTGTRSHGCDGLVVNVDGPARYQHVTDPSGTRSQAESAGSSGPRQRATETKSANHRLDL